MRCNSLLVATFLALATVTSAKANDEPQPVSGEVVPTTGGRTSACDPGAIPTKEQATDCVKDAQSARDQAANAKREAEADLREAKKKLEEKRAVLAKSKDTAGPAAEVAQLESMVPQLEQAVADATSRLQDAESELVRITQAATKAQEDAAGSVEFAEQDCQNELILCVSWTGDFISDDAPPSSIAAGVVLTVKVFSTKTQRDEEKKTAIVSFSQRKPRDALFEVKLQDETRNASEETRIAGDAIVLNAVFVDQPIGDDIEEVIITISPSVAPSSKNTAPKRYTVRIDRGYAYYSFAFMVAATYRGERVIYRDLTVKNDTALEPAFALNVFPFGRPRGVIGYIRTCSRSRWWRCLADTIGFQFGTDLDLTDPLDRVFGGLVFEPVAGLALTAGVSVREANFVLPGSDLPAMLDASMPVPTVKGRVVRPYVGVTITFDILDTLSKVKVPTRSN